MDLSEHYIFDERLRKVLPFIDETFLTRLVFLAASLNHPGGDYAAIKKFVEEVYRVKNKEMSENEKRVLDNPDLIDELLA